MSAAIIASLAPAKLNSTVLAIRNLRISLAVDANPFRHSGNLYPSILTVPGGQPMVTFQTPFFPAYTLMGMGNGALKLTVFEAYLATFADSVRQPGAVHTKYHLNTVPGAATGFAYITGASVDNNGVLMADIMVALISFDGMANPLLRVDNVSIPTLAGEPALHTLGPIEVNGTVIGGVSQAGIDTGYQTQFLKTDGDMFPRNFACLGADRTMSVQFKDALTAWDELTLLGVAISANVIQYFRSYSAPNQVKLTTGMSFTMASGRIVPDTLSADNLAVLDAPAKIIPLSASATDPVIIANGVAIPTP